MVALIRFELKKLVAEKRSLIGLLNILIINILFSLAFYLRNRTHGNRHHELFRDYLVRDFVNAYCYVQTILSPCVYMIFPMVLTVMGAFILAGELEVGSLRMTLFRPVARWQVLLAKFVALTVYSFAMLVILGVVSYGIALVQFPNAGLVPIPGPLYMLRHSTILTPDIAPARIVLSYLLALPMLMSISAMSLMFALVTRHFVASCILTSTIYFACYVVNGIPMLSAIHKYLPVRYWTFWKFTLMTDIPWHTIWQYGLWSTAYTLCFLILGAALFSLRDV